MSKDNPFNGQGGYAFPTKQPLNTDVLGITIRDYFAAKAMQGMMSRDSFDSGQASPSQRARLAYIEADAMISERAK